MATKSTLRLLRDIINDSIDLIESRLAAKGATFPSLNDPFIPTSDAEAILLEPDVLSATSHIVAAASQLIATVRHPAQTVVDDVLLVWPIPFLHLVLETKLLISRYRSTLRSAYE